MKKFLSLMLLVCLLFMTACTDNSVSKIGGADAPTNIIVSNINDMSVEDADKYFKNHYMNPLDLPILDIHIENPFISDDRTLVLNDSIENHLELMIYDYYKNLMSGQFEEAKKVISDTALLESTKAYEKNFEDGIYYSSITLNSIDFKNVNDALKIEHKNKLSIIELLNRLDMEKFAIVEADITVKHNEKSLSLVPQVGDGDVTRYFVIGKKDKGYKIIEVYWEGFIKD